MKNILIIIMLISSALFCACEKEDLLTPSGADINYFYTLNDTDPAVAALKKEFFEHTNSYLLFNDTLSKIYVGLDRYGTELWKFETVNIQWSMTGYKSGYIEYAPFENFDEQKQAASLIMEKLSSRLGIAPYSYMLSKKMTRWELRSDGTYKLNTYDGAYPTVISGLRCLAIAMEDLNEMGEEAFCNYIFKTIILDKLTTLKNADKTLFNDFFSYCKETYGWGKTKFGLEAAWNNEQIWESGYIKDRYRSYFPYDNEDFSDFGAAICDISVEEMEKAKDIYPIIYAKYHILRDIMISQGFVFNN